MCLLRICPVHSTVTQVNYENWLHGRAAAQSIVIVRVATQLQHVKVIRLRFTTQC